MKHLFYRFGRDLRSIVVQALGLQPRGGVRHDELTLVGLKGQVRVEWLARNTHPWDRDQPENVRAKLFLQRALEDADVAIVRLFEALPVEIDRIEIRVFDPVDRKKVILAGSVEREEIYAIGVSQSVRMRLKRLGIHYSSIRGETIEGLPNVGEDVVAC